MKTTEPPIIVEQLFDVSLDTLWKAITELDHLKMWYFEQIESFKAEEGFEVEFPLHHENRIFTHQWKIVEVIPLQKIKYNWKYKEYAGDSYVTFEIMEADDRVKIILSTEVISDFPDDIPEFKRESGQAGWEYLINNRLREYLS